MSSTAAEGQAYAPSVVTTSGPPPVETQPDSTDQEDLDNGMVS